VGPGGSVGPGPGGGPEVEETGSGSGFGSGYGGVEWAEGGEMLSAIWETEGLQTVGIVVLVFASIKLLQAIISPKNSLKKKVLLFSACI